MPGIPFMQAAASVPLIFIMSQSQAATCVASGNQTRRGACSGARGPDCGARCHS
jgi:hypothetical protein